MGYTGGRTSNPSYHQLGDHTESVQVEYDPGRISYGELLQVYWAEHDPGRAVGPRQYMAAVFYHDETQRALALESRDRVAAEKGIKVTTAVLPAGAFYPAEDYHQKYYLRREKDIIGEFRALFPDSRSFVRSTAVARVNGYLGGHGSYEGLLEDIDGLGLSPAGRQTLLDRLRDRFPTRFCPAPPPG